MSILRILARNFSFEPRRSYNQVRLFELRVRLLHVLVLLCATACSGADPGEGADLLLQVQTGQLVRSALSPESIGPAITFADLRRNMIRAGEASVPISGRVEGSAFSLRIGLKGDAGYWTVPVGVEDPAVQGELTWQASLDFSERIEGETVELLLQAVNEQGSGGSLTSFVIPVESTAPEGALAVRLEWDADADVDLWLTDPKGTSLSPKNISDRNSDISGASASVAPAAFIDVDSNAGCRIDGFRTETAIWAEKPPDGTYQVGVDLASPCASNRTSFSVSVWLNGQRQTRASGSLYPFDSRMTASGSGAPIPVLTFVLENGRLLLEP